MSAGGDQPESGKSIHGLNESEKGHIVDQAEIGFGSGGDKYDKSRPGFSEESVDIIAQQLQSSMDTLASTSLKYHVLELGAGTGKFTEKFVEKLQDSVKFIATDPSENFLDVLRSKNLNVETEVMSADSIRLPDKSVGCVVCAQSFHWFAEKKDKESIHRVMAPGGKLILIWRAEKIDHGWLVPYHEQRREVFQKIEGSLKYFFYANEWRQEIDASPLFKLGEKLSLSDVTAYDSVERILDRTATISAYLALEPDVREIYLNQLRQIILNWPDLDPSNIAVPYTTDIYVYVAQ